MIRRLAWVLAACVLVSTLGGSTLAASWKDHSPADPEVTAFSGLPVPGIDRHSVGLAPVPTEGKVRIERRVLNDSAYNVMLHYYVGESFSKSIAFAKSGSGYVWVGEQDVHVGPRQYDSEDGTFHEQLAVFYNARSWSGWPHGQTISYSGPDTDRTFGDWTVDDVRRVLSDWRAPASQLP